MSQASEKLKSFTLQKLDPKDYRYWITTARSTFDVHKCLGIILGTEVDPMPADGVVITPIVRKSIDSWNHRNKLTREALLNALKPDDLAKIDGIDTARGIWERLAEEYGSNSHLAFGIADNNLRYIKKDPSTSMDDHINKFQRAVYIREQCRPPNRDRLDDSKNTLFLASLGEDYNTFCQSIF